MQASEGIRLQSPHLLRVSVPVLSDASVSIPESSSSLDSLQKRVEPYMMSTLHQ